MSKRPKSELKKKKKVFIYNELHFFVKLKQLRHEAVNDDFVKHITWLKFLNLA